MENEIKEQLKQEIKQEIMQDLKKKKRRNRIIIIIIVIIILAILAFLVMSKYSDVKQYSEDMKVNNISNNINYSIDKNILTEIKNMYNSIRSYEYNFEVMTKAITQGQHISIYKECIEDKNGNLVDADTAISNYINSDEGKNNILGIEKNNNNLKDKMQEIESNKDYLTEENMKKYNDILTLYELYEKLYNLFMDFVNDPNDYDSFKKEFNNYVGRIEENETYKNYELESKYPNLY